MLVIKFREFSHDALLYHDIVSMMDTVVTNEWNGNER